MSEFIKVSCFFCSAQPGEPCVTISGERLRTPDGTNVHKIRMEDAKKTQSEGSK